MIYTPQKNPTQAIILIAIIAFVGVLGGFYIHKFFTVVALIFWMQYTAILSYMQFKHKSKKKRKSLTGLLLNPQVRFFTFEFLAVVGLLSVVLYNNVLIGAIVLMAWFSFALNFYFHYKEFKKNDLSR